MTSQTSAKLGYKLRRIRENFRLTYAEMVRDLEWYGVDSGMLSEQTIAAFESGEREVSPSVLSVYARYAGMPLDSLTNDEIQPFFERDCESDLK